MAKNKSNASARKNCDSGILYVRYDKSTVCGQMIENLKQQCGYGLNKQILNLIFLSEIVERADLDDINLELLNRAFYQSQRLFSEKLKLAELQINNLTIQINRQKLKTDLPPITRGSGGLLPPGQLNDLAFGTYRLPSASRV